MENFHKQCTADACVNIRNVNEIVWHAATNTTCIHIRNRSGIKCLFGTRACVSVAEQPKCRDCQIFVLNVCSFSLIQFLLLPNMFSCCYALQWKVNNNSRNRNSNNSKAVHYLSSICTKLQKPSQRNGIFLAGNFVCLRKVISHVFDTTAYNPA